MNIFKGINISDQKIILAVYLCLAVFTAAVYWQVGNFDFINFDDTAYVTENTRVQSGLSLENIRWAFTTTDAEFWHPLTWLSLLLDFEIYGLKAGGFHITNLILHILASLLLFWFVSRSSGTVWRSAFVAAFFALHPVHVESVAWVAERKDTLSAFFFMLTLCSYVYYTEKPGMIRYVVSLLCFVCGLMSKSMLVTLPVILILIDFWPLGRITDRQTGFKTSRILSIPVWQIREKLPFFMLSGIFAILTVMAQDVVNSPTWPLGQRAANAVVGLATHVINIVLPHHLGIFYPFDSQIPITKIILALLFLIAISIAAIYFIKKAPFIFTGWLWFIFMLLPVIGIIPLGKHSIADRYTYLASIGISFILAWGAPAIFKSEILRKKVLPAVGIVYMAALAIFTWIQCSYWQNNFVLYHHTLNVTQNNAMVRYNLAHAYIMNGEYAEAKKHLLEAVRINPRHDDYHANLGGIYMKERDFDKAVYHFREGLKINDGNAVIHCNLGATLADTGKTAEAIEHYKKAIELNPDYSEAYYRFGSVLMKLGKMDEAAEKFRLALLADPDHPGAHSYMADICIKQGKIKEAIGHNREILRIAPDNLSALNNLGAHHSMQGQYDESIGYYRRALDLSPNNPEIVFNIGRVLSMKGDHQAAAEYFKHAMTLKPDFQEARQARDKSLAAIRRGK